MLLRVFTNHRALRDFIAGEYADDALLDKLLVIDEFEKRAMLYPNRQFIDDDQRDILLKKAAEFEGFELLKIEKDFLRFIKSSSSILKFFEELTKEQVTFEMIEVADTYAEYENHLNVLKILYERYTALLDSNGYVDGVNAPFLYKLNRSYLSTFEGIHLHFEGYLSLFEISLLETVSEVCETFVHINTSPFTTKMHRRFSGFELEPGRAYTLNLTDKQIVAAEPITPAYDIIPYASPTRLFQAALVKKIIYDFIHNEGIPAGKIAVILPDEGFVSMLSLYDDAGNYNYAMGEPFTQQLVYKKLQALFALREEASYENILRAERYGLNEEYVKDIWDKVIAFEEVISLLEKWADDVKDEQAKHTYLSHIHDLGKIRGEIEIYSLKEILHLFLNRLAQSSTDLAGGGQVTVLGALECRGVAFEGVIVCDFNEGFVPKENKKDLYLNSAVRYHAGLPTRGDRQNLQLDLYHNIFLRSKKAAVVYVENEENIPSPFIKQLGITRAPTRAGEEYAPLLYQRSEQTVLEEQVIEQEIDLTQKPLSATRLKDYLSCRRRFYYKYIERLREFEIPSFEHEGYVMGTMIHAALNNLYRQNDHYSDLSQLRHDLEVELKKEIKDDIVLQFEGDIWLKRLDAFCEAEMVRFDAGYRVSACEERLSATFDGITLEGVIDRIDRRDGKLSVIDYKSGSYANMREPEFEKTKDFQLLFYHILASALGDVEDAFYYDLKESKTVHERFIEEKKSFLSRRLAEYKQPRQRFDKTDDKGECRYCPYVIICGRE